MCNVGDMLKVYTNGLYEPTPHRVINADPSRSRVSIPFFYEPAFEAQVRLVDRDSLRLSSSSHKFMSPGWCLRPSCPQIGAVYVSSVVS